MKPKIQPLTSLLNESLRKLNAQTLLYEQLSASFTAVLPSRLHATYQIASIKNNEIIITTTTPQLRYALTQFSHDFIRKLQKLKNFAHITKVTTKIDMQLEQIQQNFNKSVGGHLAKARRPSQQAAQMILKISEGIDNPELAAALGKLAKLSLTSS